MGKLILVIDDSATVCKVIELCLTREGFAVKSFPDGIEALRWLMSSEGRIPDVILLDVNLPKMNGYEVARRLKMKVQFHETVIVMISRRDGMVDRLKARLAGAKDFLAKPLTTQMLLAAVRSHLSTSTLHNTGPLRESG